MANNQNANKVVVNGKTIIDLTSDTVTAETLMSGFTAHLRSGENVVGTVKGFVDKTDEYYEYERQKLEEHVYTVKVHDFFRTLSQGMYYVNRDPYQYFGIVSGHTSYVGVLSICVADDMPASISCSEGSNIWPTQYRFQLNEEDGTFTGLKFDGERVVQKLNVNGTEYLADDFGVIGLDVLTENDLTGIQSALNAMDAAIGVTNNYSSLLDSSIGGA